MEIYRPESVEEALGIMAERRPGLHVLAGGTDMIVQAMEGKKAPSSLLYIGRLPGLSYIREEGGRIRLGALTLHADIERSPLIGEAAPAQGADLVNVIEQGKVAIGIRPDEVGSAGGFIRPGDRVNLIASASIQINSFLQLLEDPKLRELVLGSGFAADAKTPPVSGDAGTGDGEAPVDSVTGFVQTLPASMDFTQTILQDVEVLAVGEDTPPNPLGSGLTPVGSQIILLEVTPQQAEQIEFARQYTSVSMALLPVDVPYTPFDSTGVIVDDLFTLIDRIQAQVEAAFGGSGN
jgi:Flp pilus assembly protein CpaB